jgi:hypothetical protein
VTASRQTFAAIRNDCELLELSKMQSKSRSVSGLIVDHYRKESAIWCWFDCYKIGSVWYCHQHFADEPKMRVGEFVRFKARRYRDRRKDSSFYMIDVSTVEVSHLPDGEGVGGFVYVFTNASMPGLCKVGATWVKPEMRARALSRSSSVPTQFVVESFQWVGRYTKPVEKVAHGLLAERRHGKEFFRVSPDVATSAVEWAYLRCSRHQAGSRSALLSERERKHDESRRSFAFLCSAWGEEKARGYLCEIGISVDFDILERFMPPAL